MRDGLPAQTIGALHTHDVIARLLERVRGSGHDPSATRIRFREPVYHYRDQIDLAPSNLARLKSQVTRDDCRFKLFAKDSKLYGVSMPAHCEQCRSYWPAFRARNSWINRLGVPMVLPVPSLTPRSLSNPTTLPFAR